jgi:glycosyltransferase involved in cell wall biosynthesis
VRVDEAATTVYHSDPDCLMPDVILLSHGFASEYEIAFANGLARNGVDVLLIGSDNTLTDRAVPGVKVVNLRGPQSPSRPTAAKVYNMLRYMVAYLTFLARKRGHPVHVTGMFSTFKTPVTLAEAWLTRLVVGPYVLTVHNLLPHDEHTAFNQLAYRWIYRAPRILMVHTDRMARELQRNFGVAPSRILVVEHGFDHPIAHDPVARTVWRQRNGIAEDAGVVLFFGQIAPYKGLNLLLQAFARVGADRMRHLVIAGKCIDSRLQKELENAIRNHPHAARIHWLDEFVPHGEVPSLIHAADCLAMPYRYIDQSGVLLLALSSGLPIVATDVGSIREYVSPGIGEVVPVGDVDAFASALDRVVSRRGGAWRNGLIATRLEWRSTVKPLVSAYRQLWPQSS